MPATATIRGGRDCVQLFGEMLVPVSHARTDSTLLRTFRAGCCGGAAALIVVFGVESLQNATANGDTRTITFHHIHLKEDTTITFKVNGKYDQAALQKINHALRDWRTGQPINMDPHLIDALWEVYRATGAKEPIHVIGGYRSPATNAMLRRRSSGVAKFSQHMLGKAIDFYIPDVELQAIRDAGLRLQRGGVGFYPSSGAPFVHMDVGSVRHWPRVPEAQLARIMSKGPLTRVASNSAAQRRKSRPTVVASRSTRDADEDAEVLRPASRSRVTASVAPQETTAAIPMPRSRPGAVAEPTASGFNLAAASSQPVRPAAPRPSQAASLVPQQQGTVSAVAVSANDVINERGYWEGLTDTPAHPVPPADIPETRTAAAEAPIAGSVAAGSLAPWPMPDRAATRDALAYAPPGQPVESRRPTGKARVVARLPQRRVTGTAKPPARPTVPTVKVGERFNNPWMRAMIVSPSAVEFMNTSLYGAPDIAALRPQLQKPASTVMMTFCDDPHLGMSSEEFRGNAVVFVATVTFRQRTAALH
ncbi:MAG: DUF882 domain-containing protein [Rhizobiales bacterium]|nr:DUF882 domain-containing protein [Hyphomicrobiales bacterium]